jgi:hypothetical protein
MAGNAKKREAIRRDDPSSRPLPRMLARCNPLAILLAVLASVLVSLTFFLVVMASVLLYVTLWIVAIPAPTWVMVVNGLVLGALVVLGWLADWALARAGRRAEVKHRKGP